MRRCAHYDVARPKCRKQFDANQLAKPSLETVAINRRMPIARHNEANPSERMKGSRGTRLD